VTALQGIPLLTISGEPASLADFHGRVLLVVNVASGCGFTPQYAGLERLHEELADDGFSVLGFPANDFAGQEPGTNEEIAEFCTTTYGVRFPMFAKLVATGPERHPLYGALMTALPDAVGDKAAFREALRKGGIPPTDDPEVIWNFEKFLVSRDGEVLARFSPVVEPEADEVTSAIEKALASG
jgi:glutathione peroxidase